MRMEVTDLYTARVQVVEAMEQGLSWQEAAQRAGLEISQSTAYRLRQRMRQGGEQALREGRHGHPIKLRGEVRQWLAQTCQQVPHTPSREIQTQLAQCFSRESGYLVRFLRRENATVSRGGKTENASIRQMRGSLVETGTEDGQVTIESSIIKGVDANMDGGAIAGNGAR